jgi:hypothetical protein
MASLDPSPMLSAPVTSDSAPHVIVALQTEVLRLNEALGTYKESMDSQLLKIKTSVGFDVSTAQGEVKSLQGEVINIKSVVDELNEKVKFEIIKTNGIMSQVTDQVKVLGDSGGLIESKINSAVSLRACIHQHGSK